MESKILTRTNLHLIISILIVVPVAFVYGFKPDLVLNITIKSVDEANVFKALMGLYLSFSSLWIIGICNSDYWKPATISIIIFMLGLAFGRIISMFFDGIPSILFVVGTAGELVLGFYSFYVLKSKTSTKACFYRK